MIPEIILQKNGIEFTESGMAYVEQSTLKAAMDEYALQEMISLVGNIRLRPVDVYSQKMQGQEKQFFLGRQFCDNLIEALKKQY